MGTSNWPPIPILKEKLEGLRRTHQMAAWLLDYDKMGEPGVKCFCVSTVPIPVRPPAQLGLIQQVRIKQAPAGLVLRGQSREDAELTLPARTPDPCPPFPPPSIPHLLPQSPDPHQQRKTPRAHGEGIQRQCAGTAHQSVLTLFC